MPSTQALPDALHQRPKGLYRCMSRLIILAGFLLWFPAVSLFNVGNKVGIQPVFVIFVLFFGYWVFVRQKISIIALLLTLIWVLALILATVLSTNVGQSVRGFLAYLSGLLVFVAAAVMIRWYKAPERFILGYTIGGVISSLYALYQYLAPRLALPVSLTLLRNTTTFPLYAPTIFTPWRPFGFTAEPSHLAELLIPLAMLLMCQFWLSNRLSYVWLLALVIVALVSLGSLSAIISLPVAFLAVVIFVPQLKRYRARVLRLILVLGICLLIALGIFSTYSSATVNGQATQSIMERYTNLANDKSFIARSVSIEMALDLFMQHPLAGVGLFNGLDEFEKNNPLPVALYGQPMGVPNRFLATLAEQGLIGTAALLLVVGYAFLNTRSLPLLRAFVITWFVIALFQGGNVLLYSGWAFLGIACGARAPNKAQHAKPHQHSNPPVSTQSVAGENRLSI